MKLSANTYRPLTAIILLAACNGHDVTTSGDTQNAGNAPHASPLEIGRVTASVPLDGLPSCSADVEGEVYLVEAPATEVGFYRCSQWAWERVGGGTDAPGPGDSGVPGGPAAHATLAKITGALVQVGVDDNDNGELDPEEVDAAGTFAEEPSGPDADGGSTSPPAVDAGSTQPPAADAGATDPTPLDAGPTCGDGIVNLGEQCDLGAANGGAECLGDCSLPPLGSCIACAQNKCPDQYANALGAASTSGNLADVSQLFECVIGADFARGTPIPQTSCFFSDAAQPAGSLLPCYCGSTPAATCLATGPANASEACAVQVELASHCSPVSASCVTGSGSDPAVPLGDALQLLNCERAACQAECGFPAPVEE